MCLMDKRAPRYSERQSTAQAEQSWLVFSHLEQKHLGEEAFLQKIVQDIKCNKLTQTHKCTEKALPHFSCDPELYLTDVALSYLLLCTTFFPFVMCFQDLRCSVSWIRNSCCSCIHTLHFFYPVLYHHLCCPFSASDNICLNYCHICMQ